MRLHYVGCACPECELDAEIDAVFEQMSQAQPEELVELEALDGIEWEVAD